jgi:hypothetical protein
MGTGADGSQSARSLAEMGVAEIDVTPDATRIALPDRSWIAGKAAFRIGGVDRVRIRTLWKLTKSQESVNFRSPNVEGIVYAAIRVGR